MRFRVLITSRNRPVLLRRLLHDIARFTGEHEVVVSIYDDASDVDMVVATRAASDLNYSWIGAVEHFGRKRWWQLINQIYGATRDDPADFFVVLPDDVRLCDNFFDRALEVWNSIKDSRKIALNFLHDSRSACWVKTSQEVSGEGKLAVRHSGWIDHAFMAPRDFFEAVGFGVRPVSDVWLADENKSSGVYRQISMRLASQSLRCYSVQNSLVAHNLGPSSMHVEERKKNPLRTVEFADGEEALSVLEKPDPVLASMATIPSRTGILEPAVKSILSQVDRLRVYLNGYEEVPEFLVRPEIDIARSQSFGDLSDSGKFFFTDDGYRLTVDDDIEYPIDYVATLLRGIERYRRRALVGIHGGYFTDPFVSYYRSRYVYRVVEGLTRDARVHFLGTGTLAYHTDTIDLLLEDFPPLHMTDLQLAVLAEHKRIERVVVKRPANWLKLLPTPCGGIYERFRDRDEVQTDLVRGTSWAMPFVNGRHRMKLVKRRKAAPARRSL